jgi:CDP-diacylglycerol--glycerol-3-phosphate 3-phosphatidyltransferase
MITDRIDGYLARKYDLVTNFGKLADPIADKALTGMAFVGLSIIFDSWLFWTVTIVVLVREWGITAMRFVVKKYGVMPAGQGGKVKTMLQVLALGGYVLPFEIWDNVPCDILRWITHLLMAGAVVLTLSTGVQYVRDAIVLRRTAKDAARS